MQEVMTSGFIDILPIILEIQISLHLTFADHRCLTDWLRTLWPWVMSEKYLQPTSVTLVIVTWDTVLCSVVSLSCHHTRECLGGLIIIKCFQILRGKFPKCYASIRVTVWRLFPLFLNPLYYIDLVLSALDNFFSREINKDLLKSQFCDFCGNCKIGISPVKKPSPCKQTGKLPASEWGKKKAAAKRKGWEPLEDWGEGDRRSGGEWKWIGTWALMQVQSTSQSGASPGSWEHFDASF